MEFNENVMLELKESWQTLCYEAKKNQKIKFEIFESAFSRTYALLVERAKENCLDRQCVRLIAEAFLFANIKDNSLENACLAATVLTERMLNSVAFSTAPDVAKISSIYILEAHEEILLDFTDVNESISKLTKVYDNACWKKLCD